MILYSRCALQVRAVRLGWHTGGTLTQLGYTHRIMATLCYGEFDLPDGNAKRAYVRNQFLRAIEAYATGVCPDLYNKAFPHYTEFTATYPHLDWFSTELGDGDASVKPSDSTASDASINRVLTAEVFAGFDLNKLEIAPDSKVALLCSALRSWAVRWNLEEVWIFSCAMKTLEQWSYCAEHAPKQWASYLERPNERLHFARMSWGGLHRPVVPPPPAGLPDYEPLAVTRISYLSQVSAIAVDAANIPILRLANIPSPQVVADAAVRATKSYCVEVEKCYEENGLVRCRGNEKRNLSDHLKWAIEFQIKSKTFSEIAEATGKSGVEPSTVLRAVRELLRLIDLGKRSDAGPGHRRIRQRNNGSNNQAN
jgi:hypothetical protein